MAWHNAGRWGNELSHGQVAEGLTHLEREKEDLHFRHSWLVEHVNHLGKCLGESAEKHLQELNCVHKKLDALHGRLGHVEVKGATLDLHDSTLKERVDYLETMMGNSADYHKKVMEQNEAFHAKVANDLRACEAFIEQRMPDSSEKQAQELAAAVAKMDALLSATSEERLDRLETAMEEELSTLCKAMRRPNRRHLQTTC